MLNNKFNKAYIVDALIVLLNISNTYTIIPYVLFTNHTGVNSLIINGINIIYLLGRFGFRIKFPLKDTLFYLYVVIYGIDIIVGLSTGTFAMGFLGIFIANITFYIILCSQYSYYRKEHSFTDTIIFTSKSYAWLCFCALFSALSLLVLVEIFNFNPLFNDVNNVYDIFQGNITRDISMKYYFPYNLSVVLYSDYDAFRLPFFHKYGTITGLFHEPHTMTFIIVPFLFLMFFIYKRKWVRFLLIIAFIFYMLVAASTTNLLCVFLCITAYYCFKYKKLSWFFLSIAIFGGITLFSMENPIIELIKYKVSSGSSDYSLETIKFAFTPKSLLGTSFFDLSYLENINKDYDVGYLTFILNVIFLIIFFYKIIYLNLSNDNNIKFIGLFALYFFLHSTKLALRNYSLSFLLFIIFIVTKCYYEAKHNER